MSFAWLVTGLLLVAATVVFTLFSHGFGYDVSVRDMPIWSLVAGLVSAGAFFLFVPWLICRSDRQETKRLLLFIVLTGLVTRLILFASEPVLEDDYQRYLWDGAVTANGLSPYATSPETAKAAPPSSTLGQLAAQSGKVLGRINHPELRTIYPPVAQGAFALAHILKPFSLVAWRAVILAFDCISLLLLMALLREVGRSRLWAALYWWNPVVLKEMFNSAHMEAILVPLLIGGLLLAVRGRLVSSSVVFSVAAGVKIWPALLLPVVWRNLVAQPAKLALAVTLTALIGMACAWPLLSAGLDETSGLLAYATRWKTNSALFPLLESIADTGLQATGIMSLSPSSVVRGLIGVILVATALSAAWPPFKTPMGLVNRALLVTAAVFLLSPAQFPWYFLWVLPLLAVRPVPGLLLAGVTLPLYYSSFHYLVHGSYGTFTGLVVWIIWLPVWIVLLRETGLLRVIPGPGHSAQENETEER